MNIAVLSPYLPAADTTACARGIFNYVTLMRQRGHKIYLVSFCGRPDQSRIERLKPYCEGLYLAQIGDYYRYPRRSALLTGTLRALCRDKTVDILHCENSFMARYIPGKINIPLALREHEALSESFSQRRRFEGNLFTRGVLCLRALKKLREQKIWYARFNKIIVFTQDDQSILRKLYGLEQVAVIPLGINLGEYAGPVKKGPLVDVIFTANFSHFPNVDAALFFYRDILPLIRKKKPDARVMFAGAAPPVKVSRLAGLDSRVTVTGYLPDIQEAYARARVAVVPVRYGTGMCFKTLEAMALCVPVVATSVGARGIAHAGSILVADDKEDFAAAVTELLSNKQERVRLAEKARGVVEKRHNWDNLLGQYEKIYTDLQL